MATNILLAVSGLSPQVITETLYALHQQNRRVDAIHVITTRRGKEQIHAHLLARDDGQYYRYLRDYGVDSSGIDFSHSNIHCVRDVNGIEIDDIWTEEHNEALLKLCLDLTFRFTSSPDTAIFFSVAGGRKTMSSCLTLAAQMYGRSQDRIYHVLVTPEYESNRDFYYPPVQSVPLTLIDSQGNPYTKESRYAAVNLIHVPFVSIRDKLSDDMLDSPGDPATLMLSLVREPAYYLEVDLTQNKLRYKNMELDMMPARMALYAIFAIQKRDCELNRTNCHGCCDCYLTASEIFDRQAAISRIYSRLTGKKDLSEMSDTGIRDLSLGNFQVYKSRIRNDLMKGFGGYAVPELAIESVGTRPDTRFGLPLERKRLRVIM